MASIDDARVREVYVWRWMPNVGHPDERHPVGAGPGWNVKTGGSNVEFLPVLIDAKTGQVVRVGCKKDPDLDGIYLVDDDGKYLVLTGQARLDVPTSIGPDSLVAKMLGKEKTFIPGALAIFFMGKYIFEDGKPLFGGETPQGGSMLKCGDQFVFRKSPAGGVTLIVWMRQLVVGKPYSEVLPDATKPVFTQDGKPTDPPPRNDAPSLKKIAQNRARATTLRKWGGRIVREVRPTPGKIQQTDFVDAKTGDYIDVSAVEYGYLVDAITGAYLIDKNGYFYRVDMGTGQAKLVKPPAGGVAPSAKGGGVGEVLLKGAVVVGGLALLNKILSGK